MFQRVKQIVAVENPVHNLGTTFVWLALWRLYRQRKAAYVEGCAIIQAFKDFHQEDLAEDEEAMREMLKAETTKPKEEQSKATLEAISMRMARHKAAINALRPMEDQLAEISHLIRFLE